MSTIDRLRASLADRYRLEQELGEGGMATVYLAHDIKHERQVAIKVLRPELAAAIGAERFLAEIRTTANLRHPHILPLFDSGAAGGEVGRGMPRPYLYYVMPLVEGESLRDRLDREGRLPIADAQQIAREVADALAHAHEKGIIHRDVKPENILLDGHHAVVADFGIARAAGASGAEGLTQAGMSIGTPAYMSPEQAVASPTIDGASDVYSLGCVLFEMLAGQPPFTGTNPQQVVAAHLSTPAPSVTTGRADVPPPLADLVAACLVKDPEQRPAAFVIATRLMGGALAESSTSKRGRTVAILVGCAALIAAALWWGLGRTTSRTTAVVEGTEQIAVMPLSAVSDTSLARLGQDLVVTLSTTLDGVGELRTVDAATLLLNTRDAPSPLPLAQAQDIATRLGAGSVLTGTLINDGGQVRAQVALYRIGDDSAIAKASALAPATEIAALTDSLTWELLRQVWRGGTPPSPVLAGLTTSSFEALRTFLDGERLFQKLDMDAAIAKYRRAFELDSNFVQAYLRYDAARSWSLQPEDDVAHARLLVLADKLPERERLWLGATDLRAPLPERAKVWRDLMRRYPDYPPILMSGIDEIIHAGPFYGIALDETVPVLDRLARLTPDNADVWFHKGAVENLVGTPEKSVEAFRRGATIGGGVFRPLMTWEADLAQSQMDPGAALPEADGVALARALSDVRPDDPWTAWSGLLGFSDRRLPERLALLDRVRAEGIYSGDLLTQSYLGEGQFRIARGDWAGGLAALRRSESSDAPIADRLTTARLATIGAWLGTVELGVAADAVKRAWALPGAEDLPRDRIELRWFDGLLAVVQDNEPRLSEMIRQLEREQNARASQVARSLHALWLVQRGVPGAADSVRAISDAAMRDGIFEYAPEVVNRFVIARALRSRGEPAEAERYLMWIDAASNSSRSYTPRVALGPLVRFERGMAFEEAGHHARAVEQLSRFLASFDRPSSTQQPMVAEARRVVAGVGTGDTAPQPDLTPSGGKP